MPPIQVSAESIRKKTVIIHRIIAPYRVPFYEKLRELLTANEIDLTVVYGYPRKHETDPYSVLDFGVQVKTRYFLIGDRFLVWMSAMKYACTSDLVIVQQSNTNIINYLLIFLRKVFRFKLAFWGHGKNFQARNPDSIGERFKCLYSKFADHWFAYTELSKDSVAKTGFPGNRITVVNNAINIKDAVAAYDSIVAEDIESLRLKMNIADGSFVGIFCSRLYDLKRVDFLLQSLIKIKHEVEHFHFIVIGSGVEENKIKDFAIGNEEWFHFVGSQFGMDKIKLFKLADVQIMPGGVGLNIVESFALLTPLITTDHTSHGPEMIYLENGINGIMTSNDLDVYVYAIVNLARNKMILSRLVQGCLEVRDKYSIENMAARFSEGIKFALSD